MQAWNAFLTALDKELGQKTVDKWLRVLEVERFDACNLYLRAKDSFLIEWFEEHIRDKVDSSLVNNNKKKIRVHIDLHPDAKDSSPQEATSSAAVPAFHLEFPPLNPLFTFENFIVSEENLLGYNILCETAGIDPLTKTPTSPNLSAFNPIYIYGKKGVGKSHLLTATAQALQAQGLKVIYTQAETFTEHVVGAIRNGEMRQYRNLYRRADVLILDDIQILSRKNATQEELFHTFNTLHLEGKQIILGANCSPQELSLIEPRLVSRFEWGIVVAVEPLKKEQLEELLDQQCSLLELSLSGEAREYFLQTFSHSTNRLTQALQALSLRLHLQMGEGKHYPLPLSLTSLQNLLKDLVEKEKKALLKPETIVQTVAQFYGITVEDILGRSQSRECALPRRIAMHLCRAKLRLPFMRIGEYFSRDHSTVMASIRQIQNKIDSHDQEVRNSVHSISKKLELTHS